MLKFYSAHLDIGSLGLALVVADCGGCRRTLPADNPHIILIISAIPNEPGYKKI